MAPVGGETYVAERHDAIEPLVPVSGEATLLETDALGYLKVSTAGGIGSDTFDGPVVMTFDRQMAGLLQEILLTLRAILNHNRVLSNGIAVDEATPIHGAR